jgi:hypothetical protein
MIPVVSIRRLKQDERVEGVEKTIRKQYKYRSHGRKTRSAM